MDPVESIVKTASGLSGAYERLALVVGDPGSGKSAALVAASERNGWPLVNVGAQLSERLLELTPKQRAVKAGQLLADILSDTESTVVLLDDIELLFEPSLQLDPMALLKDLARHRVIVVVWPGRVEEAEASGGDSTSLSYATPDHPEYRQCSAAHVPLISVRQG